TSGASGIVLEKLRQRKRLAWNVRSFMPRGAGRTIPAPRAPRKAPRTMTRLHTLALLSLAPLAASCASERPHSEPPKVQRQLGVGLPVAAGVSGPELVAPYDVFQHTALHTNPGLRVFPVAPTLQTVTTFEGLRLQPDFTLESAPPIDVLVVPSAEHSMDSDLE